MNTVKIAATLLAGFFTLTAQAADVEAGKNKAAMCLGCHGNAGVSVDPNHPNLAGQTMIYLEMQLNKFKTGARTNPSMQAVSQTLSDADIKNLAAYFASLPAHSAGGDTTLAKQGQAQVNQCMGCHGNKLQGQGQFPKLAGQHPQYLAKQLNDFKTGNRNSSTMKTVANTLSESDIQAISAYLGTLAN